MNMFYRVLGLWIFAALISVLIVLSTVGCALRVVEHLSKAVDRQIDVLAKWGDTL